MLLNLTIIMSQYLTQVDNLFIVLVKYGTGEMEFNSPHGIAVDLLGNLFLANNSH